MQSIYTPVRRESLFPASTAYIDAKANRSGKEKVAPIAFIPTVRLKKVSGQTFRLSNSFRHSQAQPVRYFDPEDEDERSQLEEVLSHRESLHEEALSRRLQREKEGLLAEIERLKRVNELSRTSDQLSGDRTDNHNLVTELMRIVLAQNQSKQSRTVVDSALDCLCNKSQDAEAWFKEFEQMAIASGWTEKI